MKLSDDDIVLLIFLYGACSIATGIGVGHLTERGVGWLVVSGMLMLPIAGVFAVWAICEIRKAGRGEDR